jgi:membrane-bound lytic murein transglycosylase D
MDPEKATRAAARHLRDLYTHFGDWYLAMAAYDCGPGCVDRAILRTGYADFWQLRRLNVLPLETANYVPAIMAMVIVAKNARDYGLSDIEYDRPLEYDTLELQSPTHLALAAAAIDRPVSELKELNPALTRLVAPGGYALHLPKGSMAQVRLALDAVPSAKRDTWRVHRVEPGDTFASLAKRYNTTAALLQSANRDETPEPGNFAVIPVSFPSDRKPVERRPAARKASVHKQPVHTPIAAPSVRRTQASSQVAHKPAPKAPVRRSRGA